MQGRKGFTPSRGNYLGKERWILAPPLLKTLASSGCQGKSSQLTGHASLVTELSASPRDAGSSRKAPSPSLSQGFATL